MSLKNRFILKYFDTVSKVRHYLNKKKLKNKDFTIISSNCTGGFIYHWLGLKFNSPFINLYMTNDDFILMLENFEEFINGDLVESKESSNYPIGIGKFGIKIHFLHYPNFQEANKIWDKRKKRINKENLFIMLCNLGEGIDIGNIQERERIIERFNNTNFKNKIIFTQNKIDEKNPNVKFIEGYQEGIKGKGLFNISSIKKGQYFIDQFDYISFLNKKKCN